MFGKVLTGIKGMCIMYNGELYVVHGIDGNPYINVTEFDPVLHDNYERQVYIPGEIVALLRLLVKRNGREAFV